MSEKLTRFEKCEIAIEKGYKADVERGIVYNKKGEEIKCKNKAGYIVFGFRYNGKYYILYAHQFLYYCTHGEYDINLDINHLNEIKDDNRIINLELTTHRENVVYSSENSIGYIGVKINGNKFDSRLRITINNISKKVHIGSFKTPELASAHRELAVIHERRLESHSKQHVKEFRDFIKECGMEIVH